MRHTSDSMLKRYTSIKKSEYLLSISDLEKVPDSKYEELMIELRTRNGEIEKLREEIEGLKAKEEARTTYDDKMRELIERLLANPDMRTL
jgi:hypothetical protein